MTRPESDAVNAHAPDQEVENSEAIEKPTDACAVWAFVQVQSAAPPYISGPQQSGVSF